jgi:hypothetical protein
MADPDRVCEVLSKAGFLDIEVTRRDQVNHALYQRI